MISFYLVHFIILEIVLGLLAYIFNLSQSIIMKYVTISHLAWKSYTIFSPNFCYIIDMF